MNDPLIYLNKIDDTWRMDININKGWIEEVPHPQESNTQKQRKAIAAFTTQGTIPGDWGRGIRWGTLLSDTNTTLADIIMSVQQVINAEGNDGSYAIPIVQQGEEGYSVRLMVIGQENQEDPRDAGI